MKTFAVRTLMVALALTICLVPAAWAADTSSDEPPYADLGGASVRADLAGAPCGCATLGQR